MNNLDQFMEDLLIQAGFEADELDEMKADMEPVLLDRIMTKIAIKLSPEQQEMANGYLENNDVESFNKMCYDVIPDYDDYFVQTLQEFEEEYLAAFAEDDGEESEE